MSNSNSSKNIKKPSFFWLATEIGRAVAELSLSVPYRKLFDYENSGDGHPVLVLPGFMASDKSTQPLRKFITDLGYNAYGWELGRNFGKVKTLSILNNTLENLFEEYGEKVSIIGWSLGGVFARQLAKEKPKMVRQVITLGSPFRGIAEPNNATWLYNLISSGKRVVDLDPELLNDLPKPAPVPTTAIFTKEDGVVPWEVCIEAIETEIHQNIRVRGSHLGLGVNPSVLKIIANRLQFRAANWQHFKSRNKVEDVLFYPSFA